MSTFNELIDFTRSTTGTYLDSVVYGDELVTNGTFDSDTGWTKGTGWTISGGTAVASNVQSGVKIESTSFTVTAGYYTISLDVTTSYSSYYFGIQGVTVAATGQKSTQGTVSITTYLNAGSHTAFIGAWSSGLSGTFDNVSVKEVIGGQVSAGTPLLRTAAINEPRLEYDASGNPLGLLIEEARTNLFDYSADYAPWSKTFLNLSEGEIAPDGTISTKITASANTSLSYLYKATSISATNNTNSFYVKKGNNNIFWLYVISGSGFGTAYFNIDDLTTQAVSGSLSTPANLQIQDAGNGWYRISATFNVTSGETSGVGIGICDAKGSTSVTSGKFGYVYGAQVETGAFPTSYIPTSGSTVARTADVCTVTAFKYHQNNTQGTLVVQGTPNVGDTIYRRFAEFGYSNLRFSIQAQSGSIKFYTRDATNSTNNQIGGNISYTPLTSQKLAFTVSSGFAARSANGGTVVSEPNVFGLNEENVTLYIGQQVNSTDQINGHIKSIQYYPKRLSNTELQLLTQPSASPTMNLTFDGQATSTLVEGFHD